MPAPPPTTPRSPTGSPSSSPIRRRPAARSAASLAEALRYGENPHQTAAFYRTPEQRAGRRHRAAAAGQAALLQQHQRHRRRLRMRRRVRPAPHRGLRHHQARQSLRRRRGREPARRLPQGAAPAIRSRPSAASWRSTGTLDAEAARAITEIFTEVIIAPDGERRGDRHRRRQEEPAPAGHRRPARSARRRADGEVGRRRPPGADRATTPWSTT